MKKKKYTVLIIINQWFKCTLFFRYDNCFRIPRLCEAYFQLLLITEGEEERERGGKGVLPYLPIMKHVTICVFSVTLYVKSG